MKRIILVAHGEGVPNFSISNKVKTITKANQELGSNEAKDYINSDKSWPEYASTSFGEFGPLSDDDCNSIFGTIPKGSGIVSTGLRKGKDMAAPLVYTLRGHNASKSDIERFITDNDITSMVLLACRQQ